MSARDPLDLTPFWCLVAFDRRGRRMYAYGPGGPFDPACHWPSQFGGLTHKPAEARRFASEAEAQAALPGLEPWIERSVRESNRTRDKKDPEFTASALRAFYETELLAIYPDGSGLARDAWQDNMDWLAEQRRRLEVLGAFAAKWETTLAGMSWRLTSWTHPYTAPRVELHPRSYRGRYCGAAEIAALFGDEWERRKVEHPDTGWLQYDWVMALDGVALVIDRAESIRVDPVDPGRNGTKVRLPKGVGRPVERTVPA